MGLRYRRAPKGTSPSLASSQSRSSWSKERTDSASDQICQAVSFIVPSTLRLAVRAKHTSESAA